jgi:hypothetical protein
MNNKQQEKEVHENNFENQTNITNKTHETQTRRKQHLIDYPIYSKVLIHQWLISTIKPGFLLSSTKTLVTLLYQTA